MILFRKVGGKNLILCAGLSRTIQKCPSMFNFFSFLMKKYVNETKLSCKKVSFKNFFKRKTMTPRGHRTMCSYGRTIDFHLKSKGITRQVFEVNKRGVYRWCLYQNDLIYTPSIYTAFIEKCAQSVRS